MYKNAAIVSPLHRNSKNEIHIPSRQFFFNKNKDRLTIENFKGDTSVEHLSGAVMLFNNEKIKKIGFFDENFFLYFEDDDLCIRSKEVLKIYYVRCSNRSYCWWFYSLQIFKISGKNFLT